VDFCLSGNLELGIEMTWALKNIGLLCLAAALCCVCATIDGWRKELHHNTVLIMAKTCHLDGSNQLAAAIDEKMLARFNRKGK
jgi:hypothetical protein